MVKVFSALLVMLVALATLSDLACGMKLKNYMKRNNYNVVHGDPLVADQGFL